MEDDRTVRDGTRHFLEARGYTVLEAANGPDALRIARENRGVIHLLVTDVVMPRMSGRELAMQLSQQRPDMDVLYLSGHAEDAIAPHGVLDEGVEFLQKPFNEQVLLARIRRILDRKPAN